MHTPVCMDGHTQANTRMCTHTPHDTDATILFQASSSSLSGNSSVATANPNATSTPAFFLCLLSFLSSPAKPPPFPYCPFLPSTQALEARWLALSQSIQALREQRAAALAALVEGEREVMVWERRVQLEKEMQVGVSLLQQLERGVCFGGGAALVEASLHISHCVKRVRALRQAHTHKTSHPCLRLPCPHLTHLVPIHPCTPPLKQEAVDPAYGNEELAAARREVARLTHAAAALARDQEALVGELERAVEKREAIGTKASA